MRVEFITKSHAIDGRPVVGRKTQKKRGQVGTLVLLSGGKSRFYEAGSDVDVTTAR